LDQPVDVLGIAVLASKHVYFQRRIGI